jgi:hypothetical protein
MRSARHACTTVFCFVLTLSAPLGFAQQAKPAEHPVYSQLRSLAVNKEAHQVDALVLKRDAATFTLTGSVHLLPDVQGKVTGAVFIGHGAMTYSPPLAAERGVLRVLTKGEDFQETFERAVFRFTDGTAAEIVAASKGTSAASAGDAQDALKDVNDALRTKLRDNLHARILHDVLSPAAGGLFHAYVAGKKYSNKLVYAVDPRGAGIVSPEEVQLLSWADGTEGIFAAHHYSSTYASGRTRPAAQPGTWLDIQHHTLATTIETSGELTGDATTTFASMIDGLAAVPFSLYPTLRVSSVTAASGEPLAFIQEPKDQDADLWIVLPKPLRKGETFTLRTLYKGKDAVSAEGHDNYYPIARSNWYPNSTAMKDYATYDLTYAVAKRMRLVSTGDLVSEAVQGDQMVSRWKAEYPLSVAGFNLGLFKRDEATAGEYTVVALANEQPSNSTTELLRLAETLRMPVGSLLTTGANKMALTESQIAMGLFHDYFGPISIKRVHVTQQTACNYGQAWPGVIYIPTCYYWSPTVRHQLGFRQSDGGYWDSVAAHEVAHLWWGHSVGWNSYRDQWMSEGFSNLAASIYLQAAYPREPERFRNFWRGMLTALTTENVAGVRPVDIGPVTQGYRLSNGRTGAAAADVLYPKGAYILHMLRMMMWNRTEGDAKFKAMLREFIATHRHQPVTTDDFKRVVEKHMLPDMDLDGNQTMNWFFNQYVYGTSLPAYQFEHTLAQDGGQTVLKMKITQSGVHDGFAMRVPIYLELQDGRVIRLGAGTLRGNTTITQSVPLGPLAVKRAMLNHYYDVLALEQK